MLTLGLFCLAAGPVTRGGSGWIASSEDRVTLLELYTSEGCSSCPSAEAWLGRLQEYPGVWKRVVPVNFHVDYWDGLGWPDRFASRRYTLRQYRHVEALGMRSAYTPGYFVDGQERSGLHRSLLPGAPRLALEPPDAVGVLRVRVVDDEVEMRFAPRALEARALDFQVVLLGFGLETKVRAGENRGRTLEQNFVVLGDQAVRVERDEAGFAGRLALPVPRSAWPERVAIAGWVSTPEAPAPLQAVGGMLEPAAVPSGQ